MNTPFKGVFAASLTPLKSTFEPDLFELINHAQWLLESGANGVALLGSTGEANSLTIEQRLGIIKKSSRELPPNQLMIGTGSSALGDAINLTRVCIEEGVSSVLVLPPFYYKSQSDEGVFRYFSELIYRVNEPSLRIIFYNFPKLSGYNFSIKILKEFKKQFGEIAAGIKDSSGDWDNTLNIIRNVPNFMVFSGTETYLLNTLVSGGSGCISASANLTSSECQKIFSAWLDNQNEKAERLQNKLSELRKILENYPFVSGLKSILAHQKNSETWKNMLPPFIPLNEEQINLLEKKIDEFGFDLNEHLRKN